MTNAPEEIIEDLPLADGFDGRDDAQWRTAIDKILKGADFTKRLVSKTADGIELQPLYMQASQATPVVPGQPATPWRITQRIDHPDPQTANRQALEDLENGAGALALVSADSFASRGFGIQAFDDATLETILAGIDATMIELRLEPAVTAPANAQALAKLFERRGIQPATTDVNFGLSPLTHLMTAGTLPTDWQAMAADVTTTVINLGARGFKGPFITCDARPISEAGGSEAQELAVLLASAVAYMRELEARAIPLERAAAAISFTVPIDAGQFEGLAKLRALRKLWDRIRDASRLAPATVNIHAETAWRMATKRDAGVNMLRATMATFTAGVGGADSLTVLPHTITHGLPDGFARRIARNTQNVLLEESNLWRVADPAAGSGGIEALTDELCAKAWTLFQEIEREGGIVKSLTTGALQDRIATIAAERARRLAKRIDPITGTSEFPQLDEPAFGVLDVAPKPRMNVASGAITIRPLPSMRLAEPFEALRDAADAATEKTGNRPAVFLANLGPLAEHTARATWIRNLLAVGGIDVIGNDGFTQSGDVGKAFAESGASVACICSNDANYETLGEATAMALRGAGASHVMLAGKPGDNADLLKAAGVDEFLHAGIDVQATLEALHARLNIIT